MSRTRKQPANRVEINMDMVDDMLMDPNVEKCAVCGDRSNGKHYGVAACYGCKGFFRRTIRSSQSYACRFNAKCMIDKDQRNACRYCRFKRCLEVGMEPEAIRPDRDVIGKQKNPRKRKMKRESSSLPSPGNLDNLTQHETFNYMDNGDMLLSYLIDIEMKNHQTQTQFQNAFNSPIGIARHFNKVKADPDCNTYSLLASSTALNSFREPIPGEAGRVATVEQFNHAMRSYVILAIDWVNSLFELAQIDNMSEKMVMLKNAFGPFCTLHKATTTSQYGGDDDTVVLCNGSLVPRNLPRHLFEMQFFANNIVGKLIDEVVLPLRRFMINDVERSALIALTFLDGEFRGMSEQSVAQLNTVKERIQMALFQAIKERTSGVSTAASRFAGLLMTLPSVAKLSTLYIENVQMAQMFGAQQMDRFVVEVVTNAPTTPEPLSPSKHKCDVETQTHRFTESEELGRIGNELVALGLDLSANPPMISAGTSSETTTSPLPSISSSSSSLSTQTTLNKPPPLVVQHHHQHIHSNNSSHHNSPIASSAPVYPFNYGYSNQSYQNGQQQQQQQQQQQLAQQMPQFPYNSVHSNGIQSAGPFNQQTFFNQIQHSQSAHVDYHQQSCFKF